MSVTVVSETVSLGSASVVPLTPYIHATNAFGLKLLVRPRGYPILGVPNAFKAAIQLLQFFVTRYRSLLPLKTK